MEKGQLDAFERQNVSHELRNESHFFFECNELGEYFAVPREITIDDETFQLLESGGAVSEHAVVSKSEIGPRSIVKGLSVILNSTVENYIIDASVISDSSIIDPMPNSQSKIKNSSIGISSTIIASDIHDSNIGGNAEIGPCSVIQDANIGNNFSIGVESYILGESSKAQRIQSGTCDIKNDVHIGNEVTVHAGVALGSCVSIGSYVKIDEYVDIQQKTVLEDFIKIGTCTRIGKESYVLNRSIIDGSKQILERTFVYHNIQDTDYDTMTTRYMFKNVLPFKHNYRAKYNNDSLRYDLFWLMSSKKRPY
jgi:bifunctional N-acetylglucosamine-1-phosphate-uridyltransferase/glucosamine-1-phosphate-acetyltransferase GlmU-like protein